MTSQLEVLTSLLVGAVSEDKASQRLGVRVEEIRRLRQAVGAEDAALVPIAVDLAARRFEFLDLAGATYREPFFNDTVDHVRSERLGSLNFEVDFERFLCAAEHHPRPPSALIFHVGRCGSTLLANMLSASGRYLVIKEPDLVSELIAGWLNAPDEAIRWEIQQLFAPAIRFLLDAADAANTVPYRVLKLAAWNVGLGKTLVGLFPTTPAIFVCRSPLETVASLCFQRPAWFDLIERPRSIQVRFFPALREVPAESTLSPVALFAYAWRAAVEAALAVPSERLLMIEYEALVSDAEAVLRRLLSYFGHPVEPAVISVMAATRAMYAKDPAGHVSFDPMGEHRRAPLSPEQAEEVRSITADLWDRLASRLGPRR